MDDDAPETSTGVVGKVVGAAKEKIGSLTGNEELAREGRLQKAAADAEAEADRRRRTAELQEQGADLESARLEVETERERLAEDIAAEEREARIEADRRRAEHEADVAADRDRRQAEQERRAGEAAVEAAEQTAAAKRLAAAGQAGELHEKARRSEAVADALDPEENQQ